ncbi:hypothetical protein NicSoilC12_18640 [Arthrobacter sp. NicSoilC12]|nr:hypothetical protein NicSoilC12_18640 [Arthrobacter sp. NicSoilC12]
MSNEPWAPAILYARQCLEREALYDGALVRFPLSQPRLFKTPDRLAKGDGGSLPPSPTSPGSCGFAGCFRRTRTVPAISPR